MRYRPLQVFRIAPFEHVWLITFASDRLSLCAHAAADIRETSHWRAATHCEEKVHNVNDPYEVQNLLPLIFIVFR